MDYDKLIRPYRISICVTAAAFGGLLSILGSLAYPGQPVIVGGISGALLGLLTGIFYAQALVRLARKKECFRSGSLLTAISYGMLCSVFLHAWMSLVHFVTGGGFDLGIVFIWSAATVCGLIAGFLIWAVHALLFYSRHLKG